MRELAIRQRPAAEGRCLQVSISMHAIMCGSSNLLHRPSRLLVFVVTKAAYGRHIIVLV